MKTEYQVILERLNTLERQSVIGAFDKRTIIELSGDVIREIAKKYDNVQKGVGDMMSGALIETEARTILNQGISQGISQGIKQGISQGIKQGISQGIKQGVNETKKKTALIMLQDGELSIEKIAKYTDLEVAEVEQLAENQSM